MKFKVDPMDRDDLDETLRDYVCSNCWGDLAFRYVEGKWFAICPRCVEETVGYVSKDFVQWAREKSTADLIEAQHNLRAIMHLDDAPHQSIEKNIHDLGFD